MDTSDVRARCAEPDCNTYAGIKGFCHSCYGRRWRSATPGYQPKPQSPRKPRERPWKRPQVPDPPGVPKRQKWERYGLTEQQYRALEVRAQGVCEICGASPGPRETLAIDHCHETGAVRGLLCRRCNTGLGQFMDNADRLAAAISFLSRSSSDQL